MRWAFLVLFLLCAGAPAAPAEQAPAQGTTIEEHWRWVQTALADPALDNARRVDLLNRFLALFPGPSPQRVEAEAALARLLRESDEAELAIYARGTEWLAFHLGISTVIPYPLPSVVNVDLVTLRRPGFFWEIIHMRAGGFIDTGAFEYGTLAGARIRLDRRGRHEVRLGAGAGLSMVVDRGRQFWGFGAFAQASYLLRRSRHFAWEVIASIHVPIVGSWEERSGKPTPSHPLPVAALVFGFRL